MRLANLPEGMIETLEVAARRALEDVGDALLGEWVNRPGEHGAAFAVHVRRRLTAAEAAEIRPPMLDVRGTPDGEARLARCRRMHPEFFGLDYVE